jgi:hypothetical protein
MFGPASMDPLESYDVVKVFSATKAADRETLGTKASAWLADHPDLTIARAIVTQSSDASFHCLTIVFFCKKG